MKSMRRGLCLLLILAAQIFAQRYIVSAPADSFQTGTYFSARNGYLPYNKQSAALGAKNSHYANLMLLGGVISAVGSGKYDTVDAYNIVSSYGEILGTVHPLTAKNTFKAPNGDNTYDNEVGGVVVLDSLSENKKNATVLFSSMRRLIVMQITINDANKISSKILKSIDMPQPMWEKENYYIPELEGRVRRLTMLGIGQNGTDKIYHLAIGFKYGKSESGVFSGRVDFFSLNENSWTFFQPNNGGLSTGFKGLFFEPNSYFGQDLVAIGDLDKNGYNELAVLMPKSRQYPTSAIYIFFMDNEWTPSAREPVVITGNSMPWVENPEREHDCMGLNAVDWGDGVTHLLVACNAPPIQKPSDVIALGIFVKDIVLDSSGNILNTSMVFKNYIERNVYRLVYYIHTNPLPIKNHKNSLHAISLNVNGPVNYAVVSKTQVFSVIDADNSKNYSIEAGKPEAIVNPDSLFYRSGTSGFSAKTLFGLVQCRVQNSTLLCEGEENAIGSWSALELSSRSACDPYRECKRKDTVFVYVRSRTENPNTALRIPKDIIIPSLGFANFSNLKSLSHFKNPSLQNTEISWNANGLKQSVAASNKPNELSIIPFPQREGIDTIVFKLSISTNTYNYPVRLHIADTSKILENSIPAAPGEDTVWNTSQKRYIALPRSNSNGNIYSYDITQDNLGSYAEIADNYLHILKVDVADIFIAYTEDAQIKYRKITLMPEALAPLNQNPNSNPIAAGSLAQNLKVTYVSGGLQVDGLNGEFEIRAYNFKGVEIQRERANVQGSAFVKLKQNCPQVVQVKTANGKFYMKIAGKGY